MAQQRKPGRRHLTLVPPQPPPPPSFAEQVDRLLAAWEAGDEATVVELLPALEMPPEARAVRTDDRQTLYFACAAWMWQEEAERWHEAYTHLLAMAQDEDAEVTDDPR